MGLSFPSEHIHTITFRKLRVIMGQWMKFLIESVDSR